MYPKLSQLASYSSLDMPIFGTKRAVRSRRVDFENFVCEEEIALLLNSVCSASWSQATSAQSRTYGRGRLCWPQNRVQRYLAFWLLLENAIVNTALLSRIVDERRNTPRSIPARVRSLRVSLVRSFREQALFAKEESCTERLDSNNRLEDGHEIHIEFVRARVSARSESGKMRGKGRGAKRTYHES